MAITDRDTHLALVGTWDSLPGSESVLPIVNELLEEMIDRVREHVRSPPSKVVRLVWMFWRKTKNTLATEYETYEALGTVWPM